MAEEKKHALEHALDQITKRWGEGSIMRLGESSSMAVEVIRASWGWIVLLALLVGYSIISGLDRSRNPIDAERRLRGHWTSIPNEPGPPAS